MRKLSLTIAVVAIIALAIGSTAQASTTSNNYTVAKRAVCYYFPGVLCNQAMRVVGCETGHTYSIWAKNGQYLGIFQMGTSERSKYGHGNNVWAQAKAARAYYDYKVSIHRWGWEPWECKP